MTSIHQKINDWIIPGLMTAIMTFIYSMAKDGKDLAIAQALFSEKLSDHDRHQAELERRILGLESICRKASN
jgi:hypothetical protein